MVEFRPHEIMATLDRHGVRYVLVGGLAAVLHGAAHLTTDVDVVPEDGRENLGRLSAALHELHARIRVSGEPDRVPFDHSAESLGRVSIWNLVTDLGDLDITFVPSGTQGYRDLERDARRGDDGAGHPGAGRLARRCDPVEGGGGTRPRPGGAAGAA